MSVALLHTLIMHAHAHALRLLQGQLVRQVAAAGMRMLLLLLLLLAMPLLQVMMHLMMLTVRMRLQQLRRARRAARLSSRPCSRRRRPAAAAAARTGCTAAAAMSAVSAVVCRLCTCSDACEKERRPCTWPCACSSAACTLRPVRTPGAAWPTCPSSARPAAGPSVAHEIQDGQCQWVAAQGRWKLRSELLLPLLGKLHMCWGAGASASRSTGARSSSSSSGGASRWQGHRSSGAQCSASGFHRYFGGEPMSMRGPMRIQAMSSCSGSWYKGPSAACRAWAHGAGTSTSVGRAAAAASIALCSCRAEPQARAARRSSNHNRTGRCRAVAQPSTRTNGRWSWLYR